jgi:hypothetical protein
MAAQTDHIFVSQATKSLTRQVLEDGVGALSPVVVIVARIVTGRNTSCIVALAFKRLVSIFEKFRVEYCVKNPALAN